MQPLYVILEMSHASQSVELLLTTKPIQPRYKTWQKRDNRAQ